MVHILLGTFNGSRWLQPLLDSIRAQSFRQWRLLARDDGSQDDTKQLLYRAAASDGRIEVIEDSLGNLGPAGNFTELMRQAAGRTSRYVFFADQDDVWLENKIDVQLAALEEEDRCGNGRIPVLVHTDLEVVDQHLRQMAPFAHLYEGRYHGDGRPVNSLLYGNFVTGCATAINRPLLKLALPVPECTPMHDWWLALCAAVAGRIRFLPAGMVRYRQHGGNHVGTRCRRGLLGNLTRAAREHRRRSGRNFVGSVRQAQELLRRIKKLQVPVEDHAVRTLESFCGVFATPMSTNRRFQALIDLGIARPGWRGKVQAWVYLGAYRRFEQDELAERRSGESNLRLMQRAA